MRENLKFDLFVQKKGQIINVAKFKYDKIVYSMGYYNLNVVKDVVAIHLQPRETIPTTHDKQIFN